MNDMHFTRFYNTFLEMPVNGENSTFDLNCDVIGLTEVNEIEPKCNSSLGPSNTVCCLSLTLFCVVLEIFGGGGKILPPMGPMLGRP